MPSRRLFIPAACMGTVGDRRDILLWGLEGDRTEEEYLQEAGRVEVGSVYSTTMLWGAFRVPSVGKADRLPSVKKP